MFATILKRLKTLAVLVYLGLCFAVPKAVAQEKSLCHTFAVGVLDSVDHHLNSDLKRKVRGAITKVAPYIFDKNFRGRNINGTIGDASITLKIGERIGHGWWGNVHFAVAKQFDASLEQIAPELFVNHKLVRVVTKFARLEEPLLRKMRRDNIRNEVEIDHGVRSAVAEAGLEPFVSPRVFYVENSLEPMLIKAEIPFASSFKNLMNTQKRLSEEQLVALKLQIHDKARALYDHSGMEVDIQPGNLVWNYHAKRWELYELGVANNSGWGRGSFEEYLKRAYITLEGVSSQETEFLHYE